MAPLNHSSLAIITIIFCFFFITNSVDGGGGFTVNLFHRDSPSSPFHNPQLTPYQRLRNAVKRSINRLRSTSPTQVNTTLAAQSELIANHGEYLITIFIGTPPFEILAIADTGSDITWTQCKPCTNCYTQKGPTFDPASSTTYKTLPCSSRACPSCTAQNDDVCKYRIQYVDGSTTSGDLALETLTFQSTEGRTVSFPDTIIGCGHDNTLSITTDGSGIVGLGGGPTSLVNQIGPTIGWKFSYCLPRRDGDKLTSTMSFGENGVVSGNGVVSTPLIHDAERPYYYYLRLEAVTVGTVRMSFRGSNGNNNIVIDSGTTFTVFPTGFFNEFSTIGFFSEFSNVVETQVVGAKKAADPDGLFSLCYESKVASLKAPRVTFIFEGADVELPPSNVFVQVSDTVTCLAFRRSTDKELSFYGNMAQEDFLIGFDIPQEKVSLKPTDCVHS
ncbi:Aspartic proteinase CDR1 [Linum perenne]